jgi:ABC-type multidrug transport system permease subunit
MTAEQSRGRLDAPENSAHGTNDALYYVLAAFAGLGIGWVDIIVNDLLFTALLVLAACMLLGLLQPRWPWRWVFAVVIFIPAAELASYLITTAQPTRGQIYGSFLTALPGTAGAYGGAVMRRVIQNLRQGS